uniref:Uncharacterized protein n=1 Tax=Acrobeloides nanus TaxID=290746 RepID=A0A914EAW5_9BILA
HADKSLPEDPTLDKQFAELEIDRIVDQRSRELEMYIKEKRDRQAAADKAQQKLAQ